MAGFRRGKTLAAGGDERRGVANHVIGGERQHDRLLVAGLREGRACRDRGSGIPPHRLQQDVGFQADLGQLLQHHEAIGGVGDDDRPFEQRRHPTPAPAYPGTSSARRTAAGIASDGLRARPATAVFRRRRT